MQFNYTPAYESQLNGVAKRYNRSVCKKGRAIMTESGLPKSFWKEAVEYANNILNRSLTRSTKGDETPAEMVYGRWVIVKNLKVFGCVAYSYINNKFRKKFGVKSEKGYFVGLRESGHKIWLPQQNKIKVYMEH